MEGRWLILFLVILLSLNLTNSSLVVFFGTGMTTVYVIGVTCLVVSPADRERGGSSKMAEAV